MISLYVATHAYINNRFVNGYVGRLYGTYNAVLALLFLMAFFLLQEFFHEDIGTTALYFLVFLIFYNAVFFYLQGKWRLNIKSENLKKEEFLILGTGRVSRTILAVLNEDSNISVVGYIGENKQLINKFVNNLKCVCDLDGLELYLTKRRCSIIVPVDDIEQNKMPFISQIAQKTKCRLILLKPDFNINVQSLKHTSIPDLSPNDIIASKVGSLSILEQRNFENKVVLIAGGAGSIGMAIVNQLILMNVKKIICLDRSELSTYQFSEVVRKEGSNFSGQLEFKVGCIGDEVIVSEIFESGVDIVINAAAYKHVPICEENINACVINNILKTYTFIKLSEKFGVKYFMQISTDKAVRPTNVMGASKRICELFVMNRRKQNKQTNFQIVRFGNVIGSSGSVFHIFADQIKTGGPVTVTHKDITRYLMLIEDAAKLVLKSIFLSQNNAVYLLDMGTPVKISELADQMIIAHGRLLPDKFGDGHDELVIQKSFTGLRPGEKLHEELSHNKNSISTSINGVLSVDTNDTELMSDKEILKIIDKCLLSKNDNDKRTLLKKIVLDYNCPQNIEGFAE